MPDPKTRLIGDLSFGSTIAINEGYQGSEMRMAGGLQQRRTPQDRIRAGFTSGLIMPLDNASKSSPRLDTRVFINKEIDFADAFQIFAGVRGDAVDAILRDKPLNFMGIGGFRFHGITPLFIPMFAEIGVGFPEMGSGRDPILLFAFGIHNYI